MKREGGEKWQHEAQEVLSLEHFPAVESSPDTTNDREGVAPSPATEDKNHAMAVALAAEAAARVVRLAGYEHHSLEERAATLIQTYYRGYLVSTKNTAVKAHREHRTIT